MPPITTILLDAGGTLVMPNFRRIAEEFALDGVAVELATLVRAELAARLAFDRADFVRTVADPWLDYMQDIAREAAVGVLPLAAVERLRRYHDAENLWEDVIPETAAALEALAARFRLGVVSNANGTVRAALNRLGLGRFFEIVVDSAEEGIEKPDPRLFGVALERLNVSPETAAYVGDLYRVDVIGARAAGLRAVLLDAHGLHADKSCDRVKSLHELADLLAR
jgi:putative hydrolase of the HAD superfamily